MAKRKRGPATAHAEALPSPLPDGGATDHRGRAAGAAVLGLQGLLRSALQQEALATRPVLQQQQAAIIQAQQSDPAAQTASAVQHVPQRRPQAQQRVQQHPVLPQSQAGEPPAGQHAPGSQQQAAGSALQLALRPDDGRYF
jgi:hypothetical protein